VVLAFVFLLQNAFNFVFPSKSPSFVLISVIFYALYEGPLFGLILGGTAGFFLDLLGVGPLGLEMSLGAFIGAAAGFTASKFFRESAVSKIFLPVLGDYVSVFVNLVVCDISLGSQGLSLDVWREAFSAPHLLVTAFLSPFVFSFLKTISYPQEKRQAAAFIMRN